MVNLARRTAALTAVLVFGASAAKADVVLDWNAIMQTTLTGQTPVHEALYAAITQLAVFEAVNSITREYHPYLGTIDAPKGASAEAAAVAAAYGVLLHYVPNSAPSLDEARANSLAAILDGPAKDDGIEVGQLAAAATIALRENDGSLPVQSYLPTSSEPGEWQLTPNCPASGGVFLNWRDVVPLGIESGSQFRARRPPSLTGSEYAKNFNELKRVGGINSTERPQDRADVARFYAAVLAVKTWNPVASQVAAEQGRSLTHNARALALLNMAINDALIAVFDSKYHYRFWRPETAIPAGDIDGNRRTRADSEYAPFVGTPCHPSYPSAHASAAYAAREVLERIYGRRGHAITLSSPAVPGVTLSYTRFEQITRDIDDARIFGGIHFRFDQEAGARQGSQLGNYVYRHSLRRVHGDDDPPSNCN